MKRTGGQPALPLSSRVEDIAAGLAGVSRRLNHAGNGVWSGSLRKGTPKRFTARLDGDWLLLEISLPRSRGNGSAAMDREWMFLRASGGLPVGVKVVRDGESGTFRVRAELPLSGKERGGQGLGQRIRAACARAQTAVEQCRSSELARNGGCRLFSLVPRKAALPPVDVEALCRAAGWPVARGGPEPAVHLRTSHGLYRARVDTPGSGRVRATVELFRTAGLSEAGHRSCGLFLIGVGSGVKGVRAATREEGEVTALHLETVVDGETDELNRGLGALRTACETCGREVKLLRNEQLASAYLAYAGIRGFSPTGNCRPGPAYQGGKRYVHDG